MIFNLSKILSPKQKSQRLMNKFQAYIFIILFLSVTITLHLIASSISLLEKEKATIIDSTDYGNTKKTLQTGYFFIILGIESLILGFVLLDVYRHLGIKPIYMMATLFVILGVILYTNIKLKNADEKALDTDPELFNTAIPFKLDAAGII